jgi:hypothetical protein
MLLNEFLKQHRAFLEEQRKVEKLAEQVASLAAGLQKVRAQLGTSNSVPQVAKTITKGAVRCASSC